MAEKKKAENPANQHGAFVPLDAGKPLDEQLTMLVERLAFQSMLESPQVVKLDTLKIEGVGGDRPGLKLTVEYEDAPE